MADVETPAKGFNGLSPKHLGGSSCRGTCVLDLQVNFSTAGMSEGEPAKPHQQLPGLGATQKGPALGANPSQEWWLL